MENLTNGNLNAKHKESATVSPGDPRLDFDYFVADPLDAASTLTHSGTTDGDIPTRVAHEGEPTQHGDWPTRQEDKAVDERTAGTAGDSLEGRFQVGNLYSKYSRNPRLVQFVLGSNSVTAGEVPLYKPHPRRPQDTSYSIIHIT